MIPAITAHEQTQSIPVCCFQTLDAVFPKDLFSDYFDLLSQSVEYNGKKNTSKTELQALLAVRDSNEGSLQTR